MLIEAGFQSNHFISFNFHFFQQLSKLQQCRFNANYCYLRYEHVLNLARFRNKQGHFFNIFNIHFSTDFQYFDRTFTPVSNITTAVEKTMYKATRHAPCVPLSHRKP